MTPEELADLRRDISYKLGLWSASCYESDLRNMVGELLTHIDEQAKALDVLSEIQLGDANAIRFTIGQIETAIVNAKIGPEMAKYLTVLRRYQAIAAKMEADK